MELNDIAHQSFWGAQLIIERLHGSLHCNLHLPPNYIAGSSGQKLPCVVLMHGFGGTRHEHGGLFVKAAAHLALKGMAVLRFDFRAQGETPGSSLDLTIDTQIQDGIDVLEYLQTQEYVDAKRIALLGLSFGGLTAACVAAARDDIAALVLWEAVYDMKQTMKRIYGPTALRCVRARGYMQAGMVRLSESFFEHLDALNLPYSMAKYKNPVLIVQGIEDTVVVVDTAYEWKRVLTGTQAEVLLIPEADHAFTREKWGWAAIEQTAAWLEDKLKI